mmetsp:Transcript_10687/g.20051  ORF Transcript_10687/g.20051 Transcript_10687/m.20051 type:complete len:310 (-) Transcript_10687:1464-2393(-)
MYEPEMKYSFNISVCKRHCKAALIKHVFPKLQSPTLPIGLRCSCPGSSVRLISFWDFRRFGKRLPPSIRSFLVESIGESGSSNSLNSDDIPFGRSDLSVSTLARGQQPSALLISRTIVSPSSRFASSTVSVGSERYCTDTLRSGLMSLSVTILFIASSMLESPSAHHKRIRLLENSESSAIGEFLVSLELCSVSSETVRLRPLVLSTFSPTHSINTFFCKSRTVKRFETTICFEICIDDAGLYSNSSSNVSGVSFCCSSDVRLSKYPGSFSSSEENATHRMFKTTGYNSSSGVPSSSEITLRSNTGPPP